MKRSTLFLPFVIILLFLYSCENQENEKTGNSDKSLDGLSFRMEKIFVAENDCTTDSLETCTHVMIEYPVFDDEKMFFKVVKTAFQQRRKTMRNSLKVFNLSDKLKEDTIFGQRPEQLSVAEFIALTQKLEKDAISTNS